MVRLTVSVSPSPPLAVSFLWSFYVFFFILDYEYLCSETDFTLLEKVNFHATTGILNFSSYCCCPPDDHLQEAGPSFWQPRKGHDNAVNSRSRFSGGATPIFYGVKYTLSVFNPPFCQKLADRNLLWQTYSVTGAVASFSCLSQRRRFAGNTVSELNLQS